MNGIWLVAAAGLFWLSWLLMPGVGVTDPGRIFELVAAERSRVAASVMVQLASAALYVPAMVGIVSNTTLRRDRRVRWGVSLLLVGAMGSAADAMLHLLAFAMTTPGVDPDPMIPVMAFMQGPGLILLAPMILSFFAGGWVLAGALGRIGVMSRWNGHAYAIAIAAAVTGGALATADFVSSRLVGLTFLAIVSAAQAWTGLAVQRHALIARRGTVTGASPDLDETIGLPSGEVGRALRLGAHPTPHRR
jgi:hypothetical protein